MLPQAKEHLKPPEMEEANNDFALEFSESVVLKKP